MLVFSQIDFSKKVLDWDGFGFNYVETAQTVDYSSDAQDYGGFSILSEDKRREILELVFGADGLKPHVIKMFLDPFHQTSDRINAAGLDEIEQDNYDHETTTKWMRYFIQNGLAMLRESGISPKIVTTLYGPPPFMTSQKIMRGRDLDPAYKVELAKYIVSWAEYLRENGIPVSYLSLHNEGEDYHRWPYDGSHGNIGTGHDYNMFWPPELVEEMIRTVAEVIRARGLSDLWPTNGETSSWNRFDSWGYADAVANSEAAVREMGLITSHGFHFGAPGDARFCDFRSSGSDKIRAQRPELHSWTTSASWAEMDARFIYNFHELIYSAKSNAVIPWAGVQRPPLWVGGDPNPGNAIQVNEDGTYEVRDGYYYYKQLCPVGKAGMYVAQASCMQSQTCAFAFAGNGTGAPDAFVLVNTSKTEEADFRLKVAGKADKAWRAYRTAAPEERCKELGSVDVKDGQLNYIAPPNSVTTFVEL